MKLGQIKPSGS